MALPEFEWEDSNSNQELDKYEEIKAVIKDEYTQPHNSPWVVGFSGGKDSSLLLHLVLDVVKALPKGKRKRTIWVMGNDTLVESPLVINHLKTTLDKIEKAGKKHNLPIHTILTEPDESNSFWVNLIGKGYPTPTRTFRWCTSRMKIRPTKTFVVDMAKKNENVILLLGVRRSESTNRAKTLKKYDKDGRLSKHREVPSCWIFKPIVELHVDDVWEFLGTYKPLWDDSHHDLIRLYRDARGGECPVIVSADDGPSCGTTSPRFGCWTCTVVKKDKSLGGFVDAGYENFKKLADFRDWLMENRDIPGNRLLRKRNGSIRYTPSGTIIPSSYTLKMRKEILTRLLRLQEDYGQTLIHEKEVKQIYKAWEDDGYRDFETNTEANINKYICENENSESEDKHSLALTKSS